MPKNKNKNKFVKSVLLVMAVYILSGVGACALLPSRVDWKSKADTKASVENVEVEVIDIEEKESEISGEVIEEDAGHLKVGKSEDDSVEDSPKPEETEKTGENLLTEPSVLLSPPAKRNDPDELRIGFITDLHARSNVDGTPGIQTGFKEKINYFVEKMNNDFAPDFIVVGGDVIEGTKTSSALGSAQLVEVKNIFDRTVIEKYWVVGNHDLRSVTKKQWKNALGISYTRKAFEVGNYKIIILDSNFDSDNSDIKPGKSYTRGRVSKEQVEFLKKELSGTDKKVLVFMHHPPLWDVDVKTNIQLPKNSRELQEIFSKKKVFAVVAGHIEDLYFKKIDGVKYFVSPGIEKDEKYQGAFSGISIKGGKMIVEMSYLKGDGTYQTIRIKEK